MLYMGGNQQLRCRRHLRASRESRRERPKAILLAIQLWCHEWLMKVQILEMAAVMRKESSVKRRAEMNCNVESTGEACLALHALLARCPN
jgi:hypothetical protein